MSDLDLLVYPVALLFAGMGVAALIRPMLVLETFGTSLATADARNEVRAVYGGFGVAVAAVLTVAAAGNGPLGRGIVLTVGVALASMAAGRLVSRVVERPTGFYPVWFWFCAEVVMAAMLLAAAWS